MTPVGFLAHKFPGQSDQEYRSHLGAFGITGLTGLQKLATLSGGQKSRVAFAVLSMQRPHIILLDEPSNHLDIEGIDALMAAIKKWNGGVILISHDTRFITTVANQLWCDLVSAAALVESVLTYLYQSGSVRTERSRNSTETSRRINRSVIIPSRVAVRLCLTLMRAFPPLFQLIVNNMKLKP